MSNISTVNNTNIRHKDGWGISVKQKFNDGVRMATFNDNVDDAPDEVWIPAMILGDVIDALQRIEVILKDGNK